MPSYTSIEQCGKRRWRSISKPKSPPEPTESTKQGVDALGMASSQTALPPSPAGPTRLRCAQSKLSAVPMFQFSWKYARMLGRAGPAFSWKYAAVLCTEVGRPQTKRMLTQRMVKSSQPAEAHTTVAVGVVFAHKSVSHSVHGTGRSPITSSWSLRDDSSRSMAWRCDSTLIALTVKTTSPTRPPAGNTSGPSSTMTTRPLSSQAHVM